MLSSKRQKRTMIGMTVCMIPVAVAIVLTLTHEKACFAASAPSVEEITVETEEEPKRADFDDMSAMPCIDPEGFREWYEEYQGETETQEETDEPETTEEARPNDSGAADEAFRAEESETVSETAAAEVESSGPAIYRIAGETIDESIQVRLYQHLQEAGIPYWYEGALCQMFQESHGQQYAVNPNNGIDCGLYQYRITYWTEPEDIFDVDAQLRRYASDMAARFNSGLTVDEAISRHNTSDSVAAVNWEYVGQVKQWLGQMEVIE